MTETEARQILNAFFQKWLKPGEKIWIGDTYCSDPTGYSFWAGTYIPGDKASSDFSIWAVDSATKNVAMELIQNPRRPPAVPV